MTAIVFKTKAFQVYDHDDKPLFMAVNIPSVIKSSHIEGKQEHRMFSGKVADKIIDIRAKKILSERGIYQINLNQLPERVSVEGEYMVTVRIEL